MNSSWVFPFILVPIILMLCVISWFILVFLHELGHSIPALIFTRGQVKIFIGSYGNENFFNFKIFRLIIFFKPRFFLLKEGGCCKHDVDISDLKALIIIVSGPVIALAIPIIFALLSFNFNSHGFIKFFSIIFLLISVIGTIYSLFPKRFYIEELSEYIHADGYLISYIIMKKKYKEYLNLGNNLYNENDYINAVKYFKRIDNLFINKNLFSASVYAYVQLNDYQSSYNYINRFSNLDFYLHLDSDTYYNISFVELKLEKYSSALKTLNKSIQLDSKSLSGLNNRAFVNNMLGNYEDAILDADFAISIDKTIFSFYDNRAYSKIKLNLLEEAYQDIQTSISLNDQNSYAYLNLGIYYYKILEYEKALKNLEIAKDLDFSTLFADEYIEKVKALK